MPSTDVLQQFGLSRNPFTDRTAEKTFLDGTSLYVHSDLQGFQPSGKSRTVGLLDVSAGASALCIQVLLSWCLVHLAWCLRIHVSVMWLELQRRPTSSSASGALGRPPSGCRWVCTSCIVHGRTFDSAQSTTGQGLFQGTTAAVRWQTARQKDVNLKQGLCTGVLDCPSRAPSGPLPCVAGVCPAQLKHKASCEGPAGRERASMTGFSPGCAYSKAPLDQQAAQSPASRQHAHPGDHRWQSAVSHWLPAGTSSSDLHCSIWGKQPCCCLTLSALNALCLPTEDVGPCVTDCAAHLLLAGSTL